MESMPTHMPNMLLNMALMIQQPVTSSIKKKNVMEISYVVNTHSSSLMVSLIKFEKCEHEKLINRFSKIGNVRTVDYYSDEWGFHADVKNSKDRVHA